MIQMRLAKDLLVPLATTVDSGIREVIRKQEAGLAYAESGNGLQRDIWVPLQW